MSWTQLGIFVLPERRRKSLSDFYILKDLSLTKINFEKDQAFSFKELFGLKINLLSSLTSLPRFLHIHWGVDFLTSLSFGYVFLLRNHWAGFSELKTGIPLSRTMFESANKFAEPANVQGHTLESTPWALLFLEAALLRCNLDIKQSVNCKLQWVLIHVCTQTHTNEQLPPQPSHWTMVVIPVSCAPVQIPSPASMPARCH